MAMCDDEAFSPNICDEHEWAGYGDCPGCLKEYPEEVEAMHRRMGYAPEKGNARD